MEGNASDAQSPVVRNADWIDREYGREKWPAILARIDLALAEGEVDLARVLNRVKRWELALAEEREQQFVVDGRAVRLPRPFGLHGGLGLIFEKLAVLAEGVDAIVELGSGWGYNLFRLWLEGGPRNARYFALEYTAAGRCCTDRLSGLQRDIPIVALPFDYKAVDLGALGKFDGRILVFTYFSIDQIPQLSADIYTALRDVANHVTGIHFEPAGWQIEGGPCLGSSPEYAAKHDYNRNLWALLNELDAEGLLHVDSWHPNFYGQNPENTAAMISWTMGA